MDRDTFSVLPRQSTHPITPEAFARFVDEDRERLQKVIRAANVKAE
jgi:hypothetical protein